MSGSLCLFVEIAWYVGSQFFLFDSDVANGLFLPCKVTSITATWLLCMTSALPATVATEFNIPFALWAEGSHTVWYSNVAVYDFPYTPQVSSVSGCSGALKHDADASAVVHTTDCPTFGSRIVLTIRGVNLIVPGLSISVGSFPATLVPGTNDANHTTVQAELPTGSGMQLALRV